MAIDNANVRNNIVSWFENDFKESARMTTKTERMSDGRVHYTFSAVNNSGYDLTDFKFNVKIKNKADGQELGSATIDTGKWAIGETKKFQSNIQIPMDVKSISFVMYSESVAYDLPMTAADYVTGAANEMVGSYVKRKNEKMLNKLRLGKSTLSKVMFILAVVFALAAMGSVGDDYYLPMFAATALGLAGVGFIARGIKGMEGKRIRAYESATNFRGNTSIYDMALAAGRKSTDKAIDDLQTMITQGFYPDAYIDRENMFLVMTENGVPLQSVEESAAADKRSRRMEARANGLVPDSIDDIILMTSDEQIKTKLSSLRDLTEKIDARIKEKPELEKQVKEFREKYFPEVVRLTDSYNIKIAKLESGEVQNERVSESDFNIDTNSLASQAADIKKQLIDLMDNVIEASDNLIERLYEDDILDITTDIKTLQTTLASKGLLDSDFDITL